MCCLVFLLALPLLGAQDNRSQQVPDLVEKLRSDCIEERQNATRALKLLGGAAVAEVTKAAASSDSEVALRAQEILRLLSPAVPHSTSFLGDPTDPQEVLRWVRAKPPVNDPKKLTKADGHYRKAEGFFQSGDFEKAQAECANALEANPHQAGAGWLWLEIAFILLPAKPADHYLNHRQPIRHEQVFVEIDTACARGTRAFNQQDYADAEREFVMVLEYIRWLPRTNRVLSRQDKAKEMLSLIKEAKSRTGSARSE